MNELDAEKGARIILGGVITLVLGTVIYSACYGVPRWIMRPAERSAHERLDALEMRILVLEAKK